MRLRRISTAMSQKGGLRKRGVRHEGPGSDIERELSLHHGGGGAAPGEQTSTSPKANTPSIALAMARHHHDDAARQREKVAER